MYSAYRLYNPNNDLRTKIIPSHWRETMLRHVAKFAYGNSLPDQERSGDDFMVFGSNGVVGTHHSANTLGPAIIVGRKGSFGAINYTESPAFCIDTTYFIDSRHSKQNLRWLYYVLQTLGLDEVSRDTGVPGLSRDAAYLCRLALPPISDQK
jgi:type I restriction enzyme S subunit